MVHLLFVRVAKLETTRPKSHDHQDRVLLKDLNRRAPTRRSPQGDDGVRRQPDDGFRSRELFGRGSGKARGKVAVKYRDRKNPENTWTGRGRMPRWMAAATKGGKARKDDFLI